MYDINNELTNYYRELDPQKRLAILDALPEDETSEFLRIIYNNRYSDHEHRGRKNVDWWLWRCICLQQLYNRGGFFRKFRRNEVRKIIDELFTNDREISHEPILYHEYRNLAGRYLSTCRHSNYASRFMGFQKADDDEKVLRACLDIWQMTRGIALKEGLAEEMKLFCAAFRDELTEYDKICIYEYNRLDAKFSEST